MQRKVTQIRPLTVEYLLTDKGKALEPIIVKIGEFSMMHDAKTVFKDKK
ncbi:MAG: winged helix-turn-helix transcriptional regulator, partial [Nitrosarchaeum sp.]